MKAIRKTIILLLALSLGGRSFAQETDSISNFSVGVNMASVLIKNSQPMPYVVGLYDFNPRTTLRLQLGFNSTEGTRDFNTTGNQQFSTVRMDTTGDANPSVEWSLGTSLAMLRKTQINQKFDFYYGVEVSLNQTKGNSTLEFEAEQDFGNGNVNFFDVREKQKSTQQTIGAAPLAGVIWNVNRRISFGFETQASFRIQRTETYTHLNTRQTSSFNPNEFVVDNNRQNIDKKNLSQLIPIGGLFFFYHL